jgi:hypothetical protein
VFQRVLNDRPSRSKRITNDGHTPIIAMPDRGRQAPKGGIMQFVRHLIGILDKISLLNRFGEV